MDLRLKRMQPAFYGRTGSLWGDLVTLLHPPYTAWHLSYVVYGAAMAPELDGLRLGGTVAAFFFGTGIAAHALDELHSHPLNTRFNDGTLQAFAAFGLAASIGVALAGAFVISPWVLAWAAAAAFLAMGYTLEWHRLTHTDLAFGLAWGGFPVLAGYWAQTEQFGFAAVLIALATTSLSLAQRALSRSARYMRRNSLDASVLIDGATSIEHWPRDRLIATWEIPLKLLSFAAVLLAAGLLVMRI